jgi:hypothetical protein
VSSAELPKLHTMPGLSPRHRRARAWRGNLVSDAALAALCVEHGLQMVIADSDFARFTEITWLNRVLA